MVSLDIKLELVNLSSLEIKSTEIHSLRARKEKSQSFPLQFKNHLICA